MCVFTNNKNWESNWKTEKVKNDHSPTRKAVTQTKLCVTAFTNLKFLSNTYICRRRLKTRLCSSKLTSFVTINGFKESVKSVSNVVILCPPIACEVSIRISFFQRIQKSHLFLCWRYFENFYWYLNLISWLHYTHCRNISIPIERIKILEVCMTYVCITWLDKESFLSHFSRR